MAQRGVVAGATQEFRHRTQERIHRMSQSWVCPQRPFTMYSLRTALCWSLNMREEKSECWRSERGSPEVQNVCSLMKN